VDPKSSKVRFFSGDLVGMIVAEYLQADAAIVPISCNDAIDRGPLKDIVQPKTRIGSPYVVAGMEAARSLGAQIVCGWEPNGGFLVGSDVVQRGRTLAALPTRDALLPILCVLYSALEKGLSLNDLFARLPARFSGAALLRCFPRARGLKIVERFSPADGAIREVVFESTRVRMRDAQRNEIPAPAEHNREMEKIRHDLERFFTPFQGFGTVERLDYTDGVRVLFSNGDVAHFRPSGNADELRIYAVADTRARAEEIVRLGVAEPDGILRQMERAVTGA
jgi:phosphomannomutase